MVVADGQRKFLENSNPVDWLKQASFQENL